MDRMVNRISNIEFSVLLASCEYPLRLGTGVAGRAELGGPVGTRPGACHV